MSTADTKPCPYCGETIKVNAVKCRFCGEFIEEEEEVEEKPRRKGQDKAKKWLVPVGRNIWSVMAGYFGIFSFAPICIMLWGFVMLGSDGGARTKTQELMLYLGCGLTGAIGLISIIVGLIGVITLLNSEKSGMGRAIFGMVAGVVGPLANLLFVLYFWMPKYVKQEQPIILPQTPPAKKTSWRDEAPQPEIRSTKSEIRNKLE